jgi:cephalosporin hydroxylase
MMVRRTLEEIGAGHGTDKAAALGWHDFCRIYDELLSPWRDEPITLLELGWGGYNNPDEGGYSAAMWRDYFTKANINIIDLAPKRCILPGVELFCGSQDDKEFLAEVHEKTGDYHLIVDDASHNALKTLESFRLLWPYLLPGGLYAIEDLQVQDLAARHLSQLAYQQARVGHEDIESITFHHELVIVRKK